MQRDNWLSSCMVAVMVMFIVISSIGVSYSVHVSRLRINELQETRNTSADLKVEWGKLLLELSTWGSYSRVESIAWKKMEMRVPKIESMVIVDG